MKKVNCLFVILLLAIGACTEPTGPIEEIKKPAPEIISVQETILTTSVIITSVINSEVNASVTITYWDENWHTYSVSGNPNPVIGKNMTVVGNINFAGLIPGNYHYNIIIISSWGRKTSEEKSFVVSPVEITLPNGLIIVWIDPGRLTYPEAMEFAKNFCGGSYRLPTIEESIVIYNYKNLIPWLKISNNESYFSSTELPISPLSEIWIQIINYATGYLGHPSAGLKTQRYNILLVKK